MNPSSPTSLLWPICLLSLVLAGCQFTGSPSVAVKPSPHLPGLGLVRSGESFSGKVSWYSVRTNGGTRTASGEKLSDNGDTAAHRTLPFGTLVEVTHLGNGRSVILRITDRGPFKHGRILDVSIGAAKKLGFDKQGITTCSIEVPRPIGQGAGNSRAKGGE